MFVESRFLHDGNNCYCINEEDHRYYSTERGLYDFDTIKGLTDSGYKYMNYHGCILTPEGYEISTIAEIPCPASDVQLSMMVQMEEGALSEQEASKYFSRDMEGTFVELRKPKVRLHTRQELLEYLDRYQQSERFGISVMDVEPLNSFTAPEALFTFKEIQTDADVQRYMQIIARRRTLKSIKALKQLVTFLQGEGILGEEYSLSELKAAYLEWGICGVNENILSMDVKMGETLDIYTDDAARACKLYTIEKGLMDGDGNVHCFGGKIFNPSQSNTLIVSSNEPKLTEAGEREYFDSYRKKDNWDMKYNVLDCKIPNARTRHTIVFLSKEGISYTARVDYDTLVVRMGTMGVLTQDYLNLCGYDGMKIGLDKCLNEDQYRVWSMCNAKVREILSSLAVEPYVSDTYSLIMGEGVGPVAAIRYMARRIKEEPEMNKIYGSEGIDYNPAVDLYVGEPDECYIRKYNPDGTEYENINELIDIMCETKDRMIDENRYLSATDEVNAKCGVDIMKEIVERPVEQLIFVRDALNQSVKLDMLGDGVRRDGVCDVFTLTKMVVTYASCELGEEITDEVKLKCLLNNMIDSGDFSKEVFPERVKAYEGALRDKAHLNCVRASEAESAFYVTSVIREISNLPAEQQRHYAVCGYELPIDFQRKGVIAGAQERIADAVCKAVRRTEGLTRLQTDVLVEESMATALYVMFGLHAGQLNVRQAGNRVQVDLGIKDGVVLEIDMARLDYDIAVNKNNYRFRFCSLYDWCSVEFSKGRFVLYCVNADITPWKVTPKTGYKIDSYSFGINYLQDESFVSGEQKELKNRSAVEGSRIISLSACNYDYYLLDRSVFIIDQKYPAEAVDVVLNRNVMEGVCQYYNRFVAHNKEAKDRGERILQMRLKADSVYKNLDTVGHAIEDDVYGPRKDKNGVDFINNCDVMAIRPDKNHTVGQSGNKVEPFEIGKAPFEDVLRWRGLFYGEFEPKAVICIFGTKVIITTAKGSVNRDLSDITLSDCVQLADKGIFYQLAAREFAFVTNSGEYKVEVR